MLTWLMENMATIIVSAVLVLVVAAAIASIARQENRKIVLWLRVRRLCHEWRLPSGKAGKFAEIRTWR